MSKRVVTFGEIMLRLTPPNHKRFVQAESLDVTYGGAEANVAVSLANYGLDAHYVTKVPNNLIGQAAINHLRRFGVNTDSIIRGGPRLGIYFQETGAAQRPSKVVYDRAGAAIATAKPEEFDWEKILAGATWFHVTGITPALSPTAAQITIDAVRTAKKLGVTVSIDLNYRKNLWTPDEANKVMSEVVKYVDLCIANEEDAEKVFGIKAQGSDITSGKLNEAGYHDVIHQLVDRFGFKYVAVTLRESFSASHNGWSGLLYDGKDFYRSRRYDITPIVDRVGGGDSFGSGLIYALITGKELQEAVDYAAAASCLKHSITGDFNLVSVDEVEHLAGGDASGRVQR
ncbi:MAG TPA: sugar kinase [Firmicutes bacterium]|nr:sugar kinase [Bacillota bacterium]